MPIYVYHCGRCSHDFELKQRISEGPSAQCPDCNGPSSRRYHAVPVIYKGRGFYTTDYKRQPGGDAA